ncbi:hypothetical protein FKP32DRAFT_995265 [Trametes sanguinea]|nr:hypothetical protein FKP32DRAFT_995265 [Trametes sanguinea]
MSGLTSDRRLTSHGRPTRPGLCSGLAKCPDCGIRREAQMGRKCPDYTRPSRLKVDFLSGLGLRDLGEMSGVLMECEAKGRVQSRSLKHQRYLRIRTWACPHSNGNRSARESLLAFTSDALGAMIQRGAIDLFETFPMRRSLAYSTPTRHFHP